LSKSTGVEYFSRGILGELVHLAQRAEAVHAVGDAGLVALVLAVPKLVAHRRVARRLEVPAAVLVVRVFRSGAPPCRMADRVGYHVVQALEVQRRQRPCGPWARQRHVQVVAASSWFVLGAGSDLATEEGGGGALELSIAGHLIESGVGLGHHQRCNL